MTLIYVNFLVAAHLFTAMSPNGLTGGLEKSININKCIIHACFRVQMK